MFLFMGFMGYVSFYGFCNSVIMISVCSVALRPPPTSRTIRLAQHSPRRGNNKVPAKATEPPRAGARTAEKSASTSAPPARPGQA